MQFKPHNFVAWICPKLKLASILQDQYVYVEDDQIESIYFLSKGGAGYVIPSKRNVVYLEVNEGDDFGQLDIMSCSVDHQLSITDILKSTEALIRQFSVQALSDIEVFSLDLISLGRMSQEFYEGFQQIFADGEKKLQRLLQQKLRAFTKCRYNYYLIDNHVEEFKNRFKRSTTMRIIKKEDENENEASNEEEESHHHSHSYTHDKHD